MKKRRSLIWKIPAKKFEEIVASHSTYTEILNFFNLKNHGSNYTTLEERIQFENLDISHIKKARIEKRLNPLLKHHKNKKELSDILIENSSFNRVALKKRLIKEGIFEEICDECGMQNEWNNKPLSLQLDHKNGINNDNRLENLRLLCPNCHSQTSNFAGRANKGKTEINHPCIQCQKSRNRKSKSGLCKSCYNKIRINNKIPQDLRLSIIKDVEEKMMQVKAFCIFCSKPLFNLTEKQCTECALKNLNVQHRKVKNRPSRIELIELILNKSFTQIGLDYGVSDNAIRKWCKFENLPFRKKDIKKVQSELEKELKESIFLN